MRYFATAVLVLSLLFSCTAAFCEEASKDKVLGIATEAVKAKGINLQGVNIIYDDGGKLWSEEMGVATYESKAPNYGILKQGFLKNYKIVFFDFKDPIPDTWVFVDKDTGEVLTVYTEK